MHKRVIVFIGHRCALSQIEESRWLPNRQCLYVSMGGIIIKKVHLNKEILMHLLTQASRHYGLQTMRSDMNQLLEVSMEL